MVDDEAHRPTAVVPTSRKKGHSHWALIGIMLTGGLVGAGIACIMYQKHEKIELARQSTEMQSSYAVREKSLADQLKDSNERAAAAGQCSTDLSTSLSEGATARSQYEDLKKNGLCMRPLLEKLPESPGKKDLEERMTRTQMQYGVYVLALDDQPERTKIADKLLGSSKKSQQKSIAVLKALLPPSAYPGASESQPYDASASQPAPASQLFAGPAAAPAQRQGDLRRFVRTPRDAENYRTIHGIIPVKREGNGYF